MIKKNFTNKKKKNLSHEHVQVGQPSKGGIDFSLKHMCIFWNSFQIRFQNGYDEYY